MKRLLTIGALALVMVAAAWGSIPPLCVSGTLASYLALTNGCTIDDKVFNDFTAALTAGGGGSTAGVGITVGPDGTPLNPGLDFTLSGFSAGSNQSLDLKLGFTVETLSGQALIEDASLGIAGAANSGTGLVSIGENICVGADFTSPGTGIGCTGSEIDLNVQNPGPPQVFFDKKFLGPTNEVGVFKDVSVSGGTAGSASLSSFSQNFSEIPEPAGLSFMLGAGLLGLGLLRNKLKKA